MTRRRRQYAVLATIEGKTRTLRVLAFDAQDAVRVALPDGVGTVRLVQTAREADREARRERAWEAKVS